MNEQQFKEAATAANAAKRERQKEKRADSLPELQIIEENEPPKPPPPTQHHTAVKVRYSVCLSYQGVCKLFVNSLILQSL